MLANSLIMERRKVLAALAVAVAAGFGRAARAAAATIDVHMPANAMAFSPAVINIKVGDTVKWTNLGIVSHTVSFDPAAAKTAGLVVVPSGVKPFDSGPLEQGESFSHQFTVKGSYSYICKYHQSSGMVGKVIVD